jgi:hypothetical protein
MTSLARLLNQLAQAMGVLATPLETPQGRLDLLSNLGWMPPPSATDIAIGALDVADILAKAEILIDSTDTERQDDLLMAGRATDLAVALATFAHDIEGAVNANFDLLPADYLAATDIKAEFGTRLVNFVVVDYVESVNTPLWAILKFMGVFVDTPVAADPSIFQSAHLRREVHLDRLAEIMSPTGQWAHDVYGWGTTTYDSSLLLGNIGDVITAFGGRAVLKSMTEALEEAVVQHPVPEAATSPMPLLPVELFRALAPDTARFALALFGLRASSAGATDGGIGLMPFVTGNATASFPLNLSADDWEAVLSVDGASLTDALAVVARAGQSVSVVTELADPTKRGALSGGEVAVGLKFVPQSGSITLIDIGGAASLSAAQIQLLVGGKSGSAGLEGFGELDVTGGQIRVGGGDGFLNSLLGGKPITVAVDASI